MIDWLEWILEPEETAEEDEGGETPISWGVRSVRDVGPDVSTSGGAGDIAPEGGAGETPPFRDGRPDRAPSGALGEELAADGAGRVPPRGDVPFVRDVGPDGFPSGGAGRPRETPAAGGAGRVPPRGGVRSVRDAGPGGFPSGEAGGLGEMPAAGRPGALVGGAGRAGENGAAEAESLTFRARRVRAAAEYAAGRREPVAAPAPALAGDRGSGLGAGELDRLFQRDARRYDGGFTLY